MRFCYHSANGSSTLEAALILAVLLPVLTVLAATIERYQAYSHFSEIIETAIFDQALKVEQASKSTGPFADSAKDITSNLANEIELYGLNSKQYRIKASIINFDINSVSGQATGHYKIISQGESGAYQPKTAFMLLPEMVGIISAKFKTSGHVQIYATSINSFKMLEGQNSFYENSNALVLEIATAALPGFAKNIDFGELKGEISYQQLVPLRFKLRI